MNIGKKEKKLRKRFGDRVSIALEDGCIVLRGELGSWSEVVEAGQLAAEPHGKIHVVNDIVCPGTEPQSMRLPSLRDTALEGKHCDVLIIGGGISGCSIARELSRYDLKILLLEKESDLAMGASGRNDGEVHPGVDLSRGSLKHKYIRRGNRMYDEVCRELSVAFRRVGQYACFEDRRLKPFIWLYAMKRKYIDGISDTYIASAKELREKAPNLNGSFAFAIANPSSGSVSPYNLTIAYADNAVENGAEISLNTAVLSMRREKGRIVAVETNRGTVYPEIVVNASGVFADVVAELAGDRFFTIHPRRGTNSILDRKCGARFAAIGSVVGAKGTGSHTKGGGIVHTAHDNLLVGPDAVETFERENTETSAESIARVFAKQRITMPSLSERDIITYFTGVRAPTYEEDFIIEWGRKTENIFHVAGIQSPGLTTAPAVAQDVSRMLAERLGASVNKDFDPVRKAAPVLRELSDAERDRLIKENPDYGIMICRCEEISKGEILAALRSPVCVPTLDGVKRRVRPGMGRCQGGFCSPLVVKLIAEELGIPVTEVRKASADAPIVFEGRKGKKV
ncbi:MAG: NAD(P)/FAD-dependent oxidoreductase [Oscillospiraceae bacterium]|nr:NAD(P)/FAD-dependent oxidoreductase [Oscillospiraceae bacterium]